MDFYVALFTSLVVLAVGLELRHNYGSSELDASDTRATQQFRAFRCARMTACKGKIPSPTHFRHANTDPGTQPHGC